MEKMLNFLQIFFWLFSAVLATRFREELMTTEDIEYIFGNRDGIIPDYELINFALPARSKRAQVDQFTITLDIFRQYNLTIHLKRIQDNYLVGPSTGIWYALYNNISHNYVTYEPGPKTLLSLGTFDLYQDIGTDSAITLINKFSTIKYVCGVIHGFYAIKEVEFKYVKDLLNETIWTHSHAIHERSSDADSHENVNTEETNPTLHVIYKIWKGERHHLNHIIRQSKIFHERTKRQANQPPSLVVYPKILVTMDSQATLGHSSKDLTYLISYWNTVDMIYRRLSNPEVRLCITNIIIPTDSNATPYIAANTRNINELSSYDVHRKLRDYFKDENIRFPLENYNVIVLLTSKFLCQHHIGPQCRTDAGNTWAETMCDVPPKIEIESSVVLQYDFSYGGISVTAHEIGHALGITDHDGVASSISCSALRGNIMTPSHALSKNLRWSSCSSQTISTYLGSAERSCLRNPPIKMHPIVQDLPGAWLSLSGQCRNYDMFRINPCYIPNEPEICSKFGCEFGNSCIDYHVPPLDGTACTTWSNKVGYCLRGVCYTFS